MRKFTIVLAFIITIITCHNFIFASYSNDTLETELYMRVEESFYQRTKIWNKLLAGQYTSSPQLEEDLKKVITEPLFGLDMKMFKEILANPTSYEGICNVLVKDIYIVKNSFKKTVLEVLILWEIEGYENNYNEEIKYIVEMKREKNGWLLSNYEIINNPL